MVASYSLTFLHECVCMCLHWKRPYQKSESWDCPGFSWERVNFQRKLGQLTQTIQMGYSHGVMSVYNWGSWLEEGNHCSGAGWALGSEKIALCITHFALFVTIIVVLFLFLCCSVKLSLSQLRSFAFFLSSSPHPTPGRSE